MKSKSDTFEKQIDYELDCIMHESSFIDSPMIDYEVETLNYIFKFINDNNANIKLINKKFEAIRIENMNDENDFYDFNLNYHFSEKTIEIAKKKFRELKLNRIDS